MSKISLWSAIFIAMFLIAMAPVLVTYAAAPQPPVASPYKPVTGASMGCIAQQAGVTLTELAETNHLLNPNMLAKFDQLALPAQSQALKSVQVLPGESRLTIAARNGMSWWDMLAENPVTTLAGGYVTVPGTPSACLPYPVTATSQATSQSISVKQGQVAGLSFQVKAESLCEVSYLGEITPCFPGDDGVLYAFVAINALDEPGAYPLDVKFETEVTTGSLRYELVVEPAYYGFQYIDPPASLNQLMDAQFMQEEIDYLAKWRTIRTGERRWDLPLTYPLATQTSISADYGAERSYGGMVDGYHSGIDYRASGGTRILAPADGTVLMTELLGARGNAILIDHGWGLVTGYWHCSESYVTVGQQVSRGETIAAVGNTGLSTGPHLHWEVWLNGVSVDGKQWLDSQFYGECPETGCVFAPIPVEVVSSE